MSIGSQIKYYRKQKGWNQAKLGSYFKSYEGNPQQFISKVERGMQELRVNQLLLMTQVLGVTTDDLLNGHHKTKLLDHSVSRQRRWQREHAKEQKACWISNHYPDLVKVFYECPCDHSDKHNHHFDYTRPFEVIRLCPTCHAAEHKRLRALEKQEAAT